MEIIKVNPFENGHRLNFPELTDELFSSNNMEESMLNFSIGTISAGNQLKFDLTQFNEFRKKEIQKEKILQPKYEREDSNYFNSQKDGETPHLNSKRRLILYVPENDKVIVNGIKCTRSQQTSLSIGPSLLVTVSNSAYNENEVNLYPYQSEPVKENYDDGNVSPLHKAPLDSLLETPIKPKDGSKLNNFATSLVFQETPMKNNEKKEETPKPNTFISNSVQNDESNEQYFGGTGNSELLKFDSDYYTPIRSKQHLQIQKIQNVKGKTPIQTPIFSPILRLVTPRTKKRKENIIKFSETRENIEEKSQIQKSNHSLKDNSIMSSKSKKMGNSSFGFEFGSFDEEIEKSKRNDIITISDNTPKNTPKKSSSNTPFRGKKGKSLIRKSVIMESMNPSGNSIVKKLFQPVKTSEYEEKVVKIHRNPELNQKSKEYIYYVPKERPIMTTSTQTSKKYIFDDTKISPTAEKYNLIKKSFQNKGNITRETNENEEIFPPSGFNDEFVETKCPHCQSLMVERKFKTRSKNENGFNYSFGNQSNGKEDYMDQSNSLDRKDNINFKYKIKERNARSFDQNFYSNLKSPLSKNNYNYIRSRYLREMKFLESKFQF